MNSPAKVRASFIPLPILAVSCGKSSTFQNYVERQAIESTLVRYSTGLDTFDADVYASAFSEDAEFTMDREGQVYRGRDEVRAVVTGMKADRAARAADADPKNAPRRSCITS